MEPFIIGLGALYVWSIIRPGWVYELTDRTWRYSPPDESSSKRLLQSTTTGHFDNAGAHSALISARTVRQPTALLTDDEQLEAAAALRRAVRKTRP